MGQKTHTRAVDTFEFAQVDDDGVARLLNQQVVDERAQGARGHVAKPALQHQDGRLVETAAVGSRRSYGCHRYPHAG